MEFIKSIWNRITSFFGNLFGAKKEAAKVEAATVKTEAAQAAQTVVASEEAAAKAARMEKLAEVFNRIAQIASFRNYSLEEAKAAYLADDMATLARIEREMNAKKYKAPKKVKPAKKAA
jgi:hypothetical protein